MSGLDLKISVQCAEQRLYENVDALTYAAITAVKIVLKLFHE